MHSAVMLRSVHPAALLPTKRSQYSTCGPTRTVSRRVLGRELLDELTQNFASQYFSRGLSET